HMGDLRRDERCQRQPPHPGRGGRVGCGVGRAGPVDPRGAGKPCLPLFVDLLDGGRTAHYAPRAGRAVTDPVPWSAGRILHQGVLCYLAVRTGSGPHLTPVVYVFDGGRVWLTTSRRSPPLVASTWGRRRRSAERWAHPVPARWPSSPKTGSRWSCRFGGGGWPPKAPSTRSCLAGWPSSPAQDPRSPPPSPWTTPRRGEPPTCPAWSFEVRPRCTHWGRRVEAPPSCESASVWPARRRMRWKTPR